MKKRINAKVVSINALSQLNINNKVHSIFQNGINLVGKDGLVFIGSEKSGRLPFGIHLNDEDIVELSNITNEDKFKFNQDEQILETVDIIIDLKNGYLFNSKLHKPGNDIKDIALENLFNEIYKLNLKTGLDISIEKILGGEIPIIEDLKESILSRDILYIEESLRKIIGRGKGLTPSGDDLLIGLIWLNEIREFLSQEFITKLKGLVLEEELTTDISINYYKAAFKGLYSSMLLNLFDALNDFNINSIKDSIINILEYGHTSGGDVLSGIALGIDIILNQGGRILKIVIALGGNALGNSPEEQLKLVRESSKPIVDLIEDGHDVVIAHGNGPQVGMINIAFEEAQKTNTTIPHVPFAECNAMSQGYIGYHLQNALRVELVKRGINKSVGTVVTQVIVDKEDPAFKEPSKPIGSFYSKEEADKISKETSYIFKEDAGRGYRRVVASPMPVDIVEIDFISTLVDNGHIVISVGGGGIPVYKDGNDLIGIDAVIDKDFASSKLAEKLDADYLIILTAVDQVAINYGKENEEGLSELDIETLNKYIAEGHFAPGSMLPKVEAAKGFALSNKGRRALITSLEKASQGIKGETGTVIENK